MSKLKAATVSKVNCNERKIFAATNVS